eukprot:jgi/Mesen1/2043/ME000149S01038
MALMALWSSLDEAALKADNKQLRRMLSNRVDVNKPAATPSKLRRSALHAAAMVGHLDKVETLIDRGASLNARDDNGETPLHYAARAGHALIVHALLMRRADHTLRDRRGRLAVHAAVGAAAQERLLQQALEASVEFRFFDMGAWHPFEASAGRQLAYELGQGCAYAAFQAPSGATYIVDFLLLMQMNVVSYFTKSICWRVLPGGAWNCPARPFQGLHAGSQEPRHLAPYEPLLKSLRSQGLAPPPLSDAPPPHSSSSQQGRGGGGSPGASACYDDGPSSSSAGVVYPEVVQSDHHQQQRQYEASSSYHAPRPGHPPLWESRGSSQPQGGSAYDGTPSPSPSGSHRHGSGWITFEAESSPSLSQALVIHPDFHAFQPSAPPAPPSTPPLRPPPPVPAPPAVQRKPDLSSISASFKRLRSSTEEYREVLETFLLGMQRRPPTNNYVAGGPDSGGGSGGGGSALAAARPVYVTALHETQVPAFRVNKFELSKADRRATRGDSRERLAWHGAPMDVVKRIVESGFQLPPPGRARNGQLYGRGVYLAPEERAYTSAEFAPADEDGEKHVLMCRVLLGASEVVPFESTQRAPCSSKFDTGVDNLEAPTRYIVWEDNIHDYILPTHIVSFKYC